MAQSECKLIVVLKAPRVGTVKTRLAAALGAESACVAYQHLVETLVSRLASLEEVELRFTPDDAGPEVARWAHPQWSLAGQGEGDLGCRLDRAFRNAFTNGARRVLVIGSDCPEVSADDIRAAWSALDGCDVVLGPAKDGGYWLIGLRALQPALFEGIAWSTSSVLSETLDRSRAAGLCVQLLRELSDVDTEADWRRFEALDREA